MFTASLLQAEEIAPAQSGLVYKQPYLAAAGERVGLVFGSGDTIYYSGSSNQGQSFQPPVAVATAATLSIGNHRGPRLAFAGSAAIITAGVSSPSTQYGPNTLLSWRSTDGGKTWSPGAKISNPESAGMGFHALASDGGQRVWSAWLGPENGHVMLFGAHSEDAGLTWSKPRIVYESPGGGVCECCHPSIALAENGTVYVMFRNSLEGSRDLYLATSTDSGQSFQTVKLGQGTWPIEACPMDGGALSEFQGKVVTVWRRKSNVFLARPDGKAEQDFGAGKNPAIAWGERGVYLVWSSSEGLMASSPGHAEPYILAKSGGFPSISAGGAVIAAWDDKGVIRTQRLD